jgi:anti-sigma factor RsiW
MKKHELKLLTAFVDGELPSSMQNEVNELLQNSAEAREFLRLLKQDALMIRNQVPMECSYELTQKILNNIKVRPLSRIAHLNKRDDLMMRPWFSLVAVAAILAVTTFISFYAVNAFLARRRLFN